MSREMAKSYGIEIDDRGFSDLLKKQQELSRKKSMFDPEIFRRYGLSFKEKSEFIGYENLESSGKILRLIDSSSQTVDSLAQGTSGIIVLDKTPFYPESGGQLSDRGSIFTGAAEFLVEEVFKINDAILHKGKVIKGTIRKAKVHSRIDQLRRAGLARAHTATHLLQAALRKVLGAHITQQGSYVDVDRLRFDFTHHKALTNSEIENIEAQVNRFIFQNDAVKKEVLSYQEAKHKGALAFFKDKYGAKVRVISVSDYSKELCGGTHLANTSQIGIFFIASEASISSGIRRIEAIVAEKAYSETQALQKTLKRLSGLLKCSMADLETAVVKLQNEVKKEKEKSRQLDKQIISLQAKEILLKKKEIKNAHFLVHNFKDKDFAALLYLCDILRKENNSLFIFLLSSYEGSDIFVCSTTGDLNQKGISANKFISSFGKELSLKGGGKDTLAQGVVLNKGDNFINNLENCFTKFVTK
jgi:alanyl-tRNA synthetase